MGCGGSTGKKGDDHPKAKPEETPASQAPNKAGGHNSAANKYSPDPDLEDDPDMMAPVVRQESAAQKADEPGDFMSRMKQMYQVRKAKFNGANEDVDQYADEIQQSIPALTKKDKSRIQDWVNEVGSENPGDSFDPLPEDGMHPRLPRRSSASGGQSLMLVSTDSGLQQRNSTETDLGTAPSMADTSTVHGNSSPTKQHSEAQRRQTANDGAVHPHFVEETPQPTGDDVQAQPPLMTVTSTGGFNERSPQNGPLKDRRPSGTPEMNRSTADDVYPSAVHTPRTGQVLDATASMTSGDDAKGCVTPNGNLDLGM
jgi:hypothetical protein